jgi:cyclic 2,3-diphosphoglycerate synthetase
VFDSNVLDGARLALSLDPDVLLVEGSGAAVPPIEADRTVCVTSAARAAGEALSYLGPYRLLRSSLVVVVVAGAAEAAGLGELKLSLAEWCEHDRVVGCLLEPEPAEPLPPEARVAVFTTAAAEHEPVIREALARKGVDVRVLSCNLARRAQLERDLELAERERCDTYLTEIKAAAIEVVAARAEQLGVRLVFLRNRPASLPGEPELDTELLRLADEAASDARSREAVETVGASGAPSAR